MDSELEYQEISIGMATTDRAITVLMNQYEGLANLDAFVPRNEIDALLYKTATNNAFPYAQNVPGTEGVKGFLMSVWEGIKKLFAKLFEYAKRFFKWLGEKMSNVVDWCTGKKKEVQAAGKEGRTPYLKKVDELIDEGIKDQIKREQANFQAALAHTDARQNAQLADIRRSTQPAFDYIDKAMPKLEDVLKKLDAEGDFTVDIEDELDRDLFVNNLNLKKNSEKTVSGGKQVIYESDVLDGGTVLVFLVKEDDKGGYRNATLSTRMEGTQKEPPKLDAMDADDLAKLCDIVRKRAEHVAEDGLTAANIKQLEKHMKSLGDAIEKADGLVKNTDNKPKPQRTKEITELQETISKKTALIRNLLKLDNGLKADVSRYCSNAQNIIELHFGNLKPPKGKK